MLNDASSIDELKRVDHLIFVTLKYTRTVDIIRNVLIRLQAAMDSEIHDVMEWAVLEKKIDKVPPAPLMRVQYMEKMFKDNKVKDITDFYMYMRNLANCEYKKKEEYRKNVAMVTKDDEVTIDKLKELAETTTKNIYYLKGLMKE